MSKIVIVRSAVGNLTKMESKRRLTEAGIKQAERLGEKLKKISFDFVFHSKRPCATMTVAQIKTGKETVFPVDTMDIHRINWQAKSVFEEFERLGETTLNYYNRNANELFLQMTGWYGDLVWEYVKGVLSDKKKTAPQNENILIVVNHSIFVTLIAISAVKHYHKTSPETGLKIFEDLADGRFDNAEGVMLNTEKLEVKSLHFIKP